MSKEEKENKIEENLILDYEEYKQKTLENKKLIIDKFINNDKINDKVKIIKFLESEFDFLEGQQKAIFYSNEEMEKYSSEYDNDIQECRAENMKIIFKNLERMKKIQSEILDLDRNHCIKDRDMFSYVNKKEEVDYKDPNKNPLILEFIDRSTYDNIDVNKECAIESIEKVDDIDEKEEILKEIDL